MPMRLETRKARVERRAHSSGWLMRLFMSFDELEKLSQLTMSDQRLQVDDGRYRMGECRCI